MTDKVVVKGKNGEYGVTQLVGKTPGYNVYFCTSESRPGEVLFLKIAATKEQNGLLDREAYLLQTLREEAKRLESEYQSRGGEGVLNYQLCFPDLIESFVAGENQGLRKVLVSRFEVAPDPSVLVPVRHIRTRDCLRVDPKTSVWILGKTLKILAFAHDHGISLGNVSGENILAIRGTHSIAVFDWSKAGIYSEAVPEIVVRDEIRKVAQEVILLFGGDLETGMLPESDQLPDNRYAEHLVALARAGKRNAYQAHQEFYALVEALWGRGFHPFTSYHFAEE